jgi:hypothetical protein
MGLTQTTAARPTAGPFFGESIGDSFGESMRRQGE